MDEEIKERAKEIFNRYKQRDDIERGLTDNGFEMWGLIDGNPDEEIFGYDVGIPNGQVLVLINWMDGMVWIYEKTEKISLM